MILTPQELFELYEGVIKTSGHPDPLGYLARAITFSEGDPDYIDLDSYQGFMPVLASVAAEEVGATEVQSLQGNVISTLALDMKYFSEYRNINEMIIAFHYGRDVADGDNYPAEANTLLSEMSESRQEISSILYPRLATVEDVINLIKGSDASNTISKKRKAFFDSLLKG